MRGCDQSLADAINAAEKCDMQWERFQRTSKALFQIPNRQAAPMHRAQPNRPREDPMELVSMQQQRGYGKEPVLGPRRGIPEYQRRMAAGLCLYCGVEGHRVNECRKRPKEGQNQGQAQGNGQSRTPARGA